MEYFPTRDNRAPLSAERARVFSFADARARSRERAPADADLRVRADGLAALRTTVFSRSHTRTIGLGVYPRFSGLQPEFIDLRFLHYRSFEPERPPGLCPLAAWPLAGEGLEVGDTGGRPGPMGDASP